MEITTPGRQFQKEFLLASLFHLFFLFVCFPYALLKGQVCAWGGQLPASQNIKNPLELLTQLQPILYTSAQAIKAGLFPLWLPQSQAGTPLLGKMVNGIFSPYQLPYYFLPLKSFGHCLMVASVLKSYCSFIFTYLFVRLLRVGFWGSALAGTIYVCCPFQIGQGLFSTFGTGTYFPLLLCLMEMYLGGFTKFVLFVMPWATALPFLAGHFEGAIRVQFVAGAYLLARLYFLRKIQTVKLSSLLKLGLAASVGLLIASPQILAGAEYVALSYNHVWRSVAAYGWSYYTITKHFAMEDFLLLTFGFGLFGFFGYFFRKQVFAQKDFNAVVVMKLGLCLLLLSAAIACLQQVGLDALVPRTVLSQPSWKDWLAETIFIFCTLKALEVAPQESGAKAVGVVLFLSALVFLKISPLCNIISSLPVFSNFHNATYPFEYFLALGVLTGYSIHGWLTAPSGLPFSEKWRDALRTVLATTVIFGGMWFAIPLRLFLTPILPTGVSTQFDKNADVMGLMGPEQMRFYGDRYAVSGYVPAYPPPQGVDLVFAQGQKILTSSKARMGSSGAGRQYFSGTLEVPEGINRVFAVVDYGSNQKQTIVGASVEHVPHPPFYILFAVLIFLGFAVSLYPRMTAGILIATLLYYHVMMLRLIWGPIPREELPFQLPGLSALKHDASLFRVTTPTMATFLRADYVNLYGLSDVRGGDNVDLLPMTFLSFLCINLYESGQPADFELELKILGLMNVKYLLFPSGTKLNHPDLTSVHDGTDLVIQENRKAMPRAVFYEHAQFFPLPDDMAAWPDMNTVLSKLISVVKADFNFQNTLLLNELPVANESSTAPPATGPSRVAIEKYGATLVRLHVETDKPGFVFLSDSYFPGWFATVNGQRRPILRAWLAFRAVEVPAGVSTVEFIYRPMKIWLTVFLSAGLCLLWAVGYAVAWKRNYLQRNVRVAPVVHKKKTIASVQKLPGVELSPFPVQAVQLVLTVQIVCVLVFWTWWALCRAL